MQLLGFLGHLSSPGIRERLMYSVSQSEFPFRFSYANMPGVAVAGTRSVQRRNEFCPDRIRPVFSHLAGAKRISGKRERKAPREAGPVRSIEVSEIRIRSFGLGSQFEALHFPVLNLRLFKALLFSGTLTSAVCSVSKSQKSLRETKTPYFSMYRWRPSSRFETRQGSMVPSSRNRIQRGRLVPPW